MERPFGRYAGTQTALALASILLTAASVGCAAKAPEPVSITGDAPGLTERQSGANSGAGKAKAESGGGAGSFSAVAAGATAGAGGGAGSIVEFPSNIAAYRPEGSTTVKVDAASINLKEVFEDLGPDAIEWYQHVQALADPFFEGRVPGSRGAALTDDYIEFYLKLAGLQPAFDGSYRQPFTFLARGQAPTIQRAAMSIGGEALIDGEQFTVLGMSGAGEATGPVAFVGYGIARGPEGYSSYDPDTDLQGRVALLLRDAPMGEDDAALWEPRQGRQLSSLDRKIRSAAERGAVAVIVVNPPGAPAERPALEPLAASSRMGRGAATVPVVQITADMASDLLRRAGAADRDLRAWRRLADTGEITTVALADDVAVSIAVSLERHGVEAANVAGVLPGRGALANEWIIIGAHEDHLGTGNLGGLSNQKDLGQLHPGADDNASGTAGVLVLARKLVEAYDDAPPRKDLRSILFVAFDAEEQGLHGSRHLAENLPMPAGSVSLMLNMDMIGRMTGGNLSILGAGTGEGLTELLRPHIEASGLTVALNEGGSGRSDDANFHRARIPAVHFFTGMRPEYHSPADLAYTVNPAGATEVLDLMDDVVLDVASRPDRLTFKETARSGGRGGPGADAGPARSYGPVSLGVRPGMDDSGSGVVVEMVFEGGSAEAAGIKEGDVIVAWGDDPIQGPGDLRDQYQDHKPGDVVKLTVERDGERLVLDVTLQAPRQR